MAKKYDHVYKALCKGIQASMLQKRAEQKQSMNRARTEQEQSKSRARIEQEPRKNRALTSLTHLGVFKVDLN